MPTIGLFFTSLLPAELISSEGWWKVLSTPSVATLENYRDIFDNEAITCALWTTVWIALGATILPIVVAALAAYAFAWMDFPGRDWLFVGVVALLVVPIQMALIPIFSLYDRVHLFDTIPGLILFHTAFGLPFAIFLLRNFFVGIPARPARGGADRRRLGDPDLHAADPAARAGRRSRRSRSSSSCGRGTTCSSRCRWRATRSRSPWRSSRSCGSSAPTST